MRNVIKRSWLILSLALVCAACGPVTFRVRGTVLNPLHDQTKDDPEAAHTPSVLMIVRKETRDQQFRYVIVGPQARPRSLMVLGEFCDIVADKATSSRLIFDCLLSSNLKDELVDMHYRFTLVLPDGRRIAGQIYTLDRLQDHSVTVTGAHLQPYLVVIDHAAQTITQDSYVQQVENRYDNYSRRFRIIFEDKNIVSHETAYLELIIDGYQMRWIYHYDLTDDTEKALGWWIEHME